MLGIADIADDLGMSRSTTHRYVITLVALGYLEQGASRKYRLGLRVTDLGMSALNSTGLREHAHPYLEELRQRTSYTANLAVLEGTDVLYVDRVRSFRRGQNKIDLDLHTGSRLPAYCTSMGKLLLANLPEPEQRELLAAMKIDQARARTRSRARRRCARSSSRSTRPASRSTTRSSRPSCTRSQRQCATRPATSSPRSTSPPTAR